MPRGHAKPSMVSSGQKGCQSHPLLVGLQIGAAVKFNVNNLQTMQEAGGFRRITQLMQWTAFTFHAADSGSSRKPSHSPRQQTQTASAPSSPRLGLKSLTIRSRHAKLTAGLLHTPCSENDTSLFIILAPMYHIEANSCAAVQDKCSRASCKAVLLVSYTTCAVCKVHCVRCIS